MFRVGPARLVEPGARTPQRCRVDPRQRGFPRPARARLPAPVCARAFETFVLPRGLARDPPLRALLLPRPTPGAVYVVVESYLVDPASSHMLVSKIKPCMSKFTLFHGETANGSLNQSRFLR